MSFLSLSVDVTVVPDTGRDEWIARVAVRVTGRDGFVLEARRPSALMAIMAARESAADASRFPAWSRDVVADVIRVMLERELELRSAVR